MPEDNSPSEQHSKRPETQATRREVLYAGGALGAFGLTTQLTRSIDTVEIAEAERNGKPLSTTEVPRQWFEHIKHVRNVRDRIHDRYRDEPWYEYIAQTAADSDIHGLRRHRLRIYTPNPATAKKVIPNDVDGIPISIVKSRKKHMDDHLGSSTCDENTGTYNCVPGGGYLRDNSGGGHSCWTSTCIGERSGSYYLMTCAHPFGTCGDAIEGDPVYHGKNNPIKVGDVTTYNHDYDVALVDQSGGINGVDNTIIGESDEVLGAVSESYCDTLISNYDTVYHTGISTGKTNGYLDEKVKSSRRDCDRTTVEFIKSTANAGGGDSGGPHYWINTDYNYIAILGIHSYHTHTYHGNHYRSFGPAGYAIQNNLNFNFGASSSTC